MDEAMEELHALFGDRPLPRPAEDILRDAWRINMFNELEVLRYPHYSPEDMDAVCEVVGVMALAAERELVHCMEEAEEMVELRKPATGTEATLIKGRLGDPSTRPRR